MSTQVVVPEQTMPIPVPEPAQKKVNILDAAMLLTVVRRWPPKSKIVADKSIVQTSAQPGMLSLNKKLWDAPQMRAIENNENVLDQFLKFNASAMPLRAGHYLVAMDLYTKVKARIIEHNTARETLIDAFVAAYDDAIIRSKELLGDQYRATDYPTKEQVKGLFYFGHSWLDFSVAGKLQEVDQEAAERQAAQLEGEIHQAAEVQKDLLRKEMQGIVAHLLDRFTPREVEGELKKKVIRDTVLDKITDFREIFPAKNLAQDEKLGALVQQANSLLSGVSADKIRADDNLRESMQKGFEAIKTQIDKLLVDEPSRSISFEEL
jgi:hypothetical protein